MLMSYFWPGNVRELENCMEYAVLNTSDNVVSGYNLPPSLQTDISCKSAPAGGISAPEAADYETLVANFEREIIINALKKTNGNATAAAKNLHTTARIILYKIKNLGIDPHLYKIS